MSLNLEQDESYLELKNDDNKKKGKLKINDINDKYFNPKTRNSKD